MYTYAKERKHYEEIYDDSTVEHCRTGERIVNNTFKELETKVSAKEIAERKPGWYLLYSQLYFGYVEVVAAKRVSEREETISKWMERDIAKDHRLAEAHITSGTYCRKCGKDMQVLDKHYMNRDGRKDDDILVMFECSSCNKRQAFWQDGTEWHVKPVQCTKCDGEMKSVHKTKGKVITTTMTCNKCGHIEKEVMDLSKGESDEQPPDPFYELDHKRFIFNDEMIFKFQQKAAHFERLLKVHQDTAERAEHADTYVAIKDIKKLKIVQLSELLEPVLAKQQYTGFKLGEPQLGREVTLDFSCLDAKPDREDYESKKTLQKQITKALDGTNWRLMSDGVSYRLGYLSGRLRAYESEEELKKLIEQKSKKGIAKVVTPSPSQEEVSSNSRPSTLAPAELNIRESALVYMHNMTLDSVPAEITLKSGKKKKTSIPIIRAEINPLLRVFIPMRDNDESVPAFIRSFDFTFGDKTKTIPKVTKDSQGREIRRL
jgi:hypothetical protein